MIGEVGGIGAASFVQRILRPVEQRNHLHHSADHGGQSEYVSCAGLVRDIELLPLLRPRQGIFFGAILSRNTRNGVIGHLSPSPLWRRTTNSVAAIIFGVSQLCKSAENCIFLISLKSRVGTCCVARSSNDGMKRMDFNAVFPCECNHFGILGIAHKNPALQISLPRFCQKLRRLSHAHSLFFSLFIPKTSWLLGNVLAQSR